MKTTEVQMKSWPEDPQDRAKLQAQQDIRASEGTFLPSSSAERDLLSLNHTILKPGVRNLKNGS